MTATDWQQLATGVIGLALGLALLWVIALLYALHARLEGLAGAWSKKLAEMGDKLAALDKDLRG